MLAVGVTAGAAVGVGLAVTVGVSVTVVPFCAFAMPMAVMPPAMTASVIPAPTSAPLICMPYTVPRATVNAQELTGSHPFRPESGATMPPSLARIDKALTRAGERITSVVGTMWMALAFAAIACVSGPAAFHTGNPLVIVQWTAGVFLQLVLLPIIIVGQNAQGAKTEARDTETHDAVMAEHAETREILASVHQLVAEIHPAVAPGVKS